MKKRDTGVEPVSRPPEPTIRQAVASATPKPLAHTLARPAACEHDLQHLLDTWPTLAEPIRRAMLALLQCATDTPGIAPTTSGTAPNR
jgi:hypothetical protein